MKLTNNLLIFTIAIFFLSLSCNSYNIEDTVFLKSEDFVYHLENKYDRQFEIIISEENKVERIYLLDNKRETILNSFFYDNNNLIKYVFDENELFRIEFTKDSLLIEGEPFFLIFGGEDNENEKKDYFESYIAYACPYFAQCELQIINVDSNKVEETKKLTDTDYTFMFKGLKGIRYDFAYTLKNDSLNLDYSHLFYIDLPISEK